MGEESRLQKNPNTRPNASKKKGSLKLSLAPSFCADKHPNPALGSAISPMMFEFDDAKSGSNQAKHGIDFVAAQALWKSKLALLPAKDVGKGATSSLASSRGSIGPR